MDLEIETGVCRGPLSPFNVGCVRRGGIDAVGQYHCIRNGSGAQANKKGKWDLHCKSFSEQHLMMEDVKPPKRKKDPSKEKSSKKEKKEKKSKKLKLSEPS